MALSDKSRLVLGLLADGHSHSQIVESGRGLTYLDIMRAAEEALGHDPVDAPHVEPGTESPDESAMHRAKRLHPRAYERWDADEDNELRELVKSRRSVKEIAEHLGRQDSAIQSRIGKLGLDESKGA
jgi:hypothetical protein